MAKKIKLKKLNDKEKIKEVDTWYKNISKYKTSFKMIPLDPKNPFKISKEKANNKIKKNMEFKDLQDYITKYNNKLVSSINEVTAIKDNIKASIKNLSKLLDKSKKGWGILMLSAANDLESYKTAKEKLSDKEITVAENSDVRDELFNKLLENWVEKFKKSTNDLEDLGKTLLDNVTEQKGFKKNIKFLLNPNNFKKEVYDANEDKKPEKRAKLVNTLTAMKKFMVNLYNTLTDSKSNISKIISYDIEYIQDLSKILDSLEQEFSKKNKQAKK